MSNLKISKERREYLKQLKKKKVLVLITQIFVLIGFLFLWEILANNGIVDSFITSKPSRIFETFMNLQQNDLIKHIEVTVYETVIGFFFGTLLGIFIAILLWWFDFLSKVTEPYLVVLNSLPKVALRANYNYMGRCRNISYNSYGCSNIINSNNIRKFKWICKY